MKIGICDDDMHELSQISACLEKYQNERQMKFTYKAFRNGIDLIDAASKGEYDIIFLDILMPGLSGMETAKEIRSFDNNIKIVFLTSSPEFAVESYSVGAYHYLIKPASVEKLFPILDKLIQDTRKPQNGLNVKTQSGIFRIPFDSLEYVEVISKTVSFHLTDGSVKKAFSSLKDFEEKLLERSEFVKVHRSYIVNMAWIQELGVKEITTESKQKIPISRSLYSSVRCEYIKHLYTEKGME